MRINCEGNTHLMKSNNRARLAAIVCSVGALAGIGVQSASAADNVLDDYQTSASGSFGAIRSSAAFDDTNCNPNSTTNCSGLNGAKPRYVVVKYTNKSINLQNGFLARDLYGDSTSNYVSDAIYLTFTRQADDGGYAVWRANMPASVGGAVNRIKFSIYATQSYSAVVACGLNPYGLAHTC